MSHNAEVPKPSPESESRLLASEELEQTPSEPCQKLETEHFTKPPASDDDDREAVVTLDPSSAENSLQSSPSPFKVEKIAADAQSLLDIRENLELLQVGLQNEVQAREALKEMVLQESAVLHSLRAAYQDEYRKLNERLDAECKPRDEALAASCESQPCGKLENGADTPAQEPERAALEAARQQTVSWKLKQQVAKLEEQVKHIEASIAESQVGLSTWLAEHKARQETQTPHRQDSGEKVDCPELLKEESAFSCKENCPETSGGPVHFLLATPKPMARALSSVTPSVNEVDWKEEVRVLSGRVAELQTNFAAQLGEGLNAVNGRVAASDEAQAQLKKQMHHAGAAMEQAFRTLTKNYEDSLKKQSDLRALLEDEVDQRGVFCDGVHKGLEDMLAQQLKQQDTLLTERDKKLVADMKAEIALRADELREDLLRRFNKLTL